ncbi:MAG: hypothetical protein AUI47_08690 [Acidobacteria bacterium 13_1_40CM_2_68_5]|nr:MAG: hypothetical protein AUI47_08690 [Acidobacteria bacterium 13_1_40CM_2_68_5]
MTVVRSYCSIGPSASSSCGIVGWVLPFFTFTVESTTGARYILAVFATATMFSTSERRSIEATDVTWIGWTSMIRTAEF